LKIRSININGMFITPYSILGIFLLFLCLAKSTIMILGYSFVPNNWFVHNNIILAIFIFLTYKAIRNKNAKTKFSENISFFLPALTVYYIVINYIPGNIFGIKYYLNIIFSISMFICSILIFACCINIKRAKTIVGVIYTIISILIFLTMWLLISLLIVTNTEVVDYKISPNSKYLVEIIEIGQGALGGSTDVRVFMQKNILIGTLRTTPVVIFSGRFRQMSGAVLRWEDDGILYINNTQYIIKDIIN